ncbi:MAG TPA: metalloregulator ArsR/SmtB family transcription factor [Cyclobacteriaceae bacterium]|nr:metalloregulator ArsR/SmtB family transcription factor [Cyclobacteriaceae bacterium]
METRRDVFQAIADPNRRAILGLLAKKTQTLNGVADNFNISRPAISRHMKILMECGLVVINQQGRERYCEVQMDRLEEVTDWVDKYKKIWEQRFDKLELYLTEIQRKKKHKK